MQERIRNCILQIVSEAAGTRGEGVYLIDLKIKGKASARKLEILMDADIGIRIHQCAWFSRRIREAIEVDDELLDLIGENFDLMVSSPGLGEPILNPRQYQRHIGKLFLVRYAAISGDQHEIRGHLQSVLLQEERGGHIVLMPEQSKKRESKASEEALTLYLDEIIYAIPEGEL